jgi:DNA-directed RNA polymerase subunit omega
MARVTIEDCLKVVGNRFELLMIAASRAKEIISGSMSATTVQGKATVVALREIAEGALNIDQIKENIVKGYQIYQFMNEDDPEQEESIDEIFHDKAFSNMNKMQSIDEEENSADDIEEEVDYKISDEHIASFENEEENIEE